MAKKKKSSSKKQSASAAPAQSVPVNGGLAILAVLGVMVFTLLANPLRLEANEPHRAGILALVVLFLLPYVRQIEFNRKSMPVLIGALLWSVALILTTVFALSVPHSINGDMLRRMGLWTHLVLVAGLLLGTMLPVSSTGRLFWLVGIVVTAYMVLQQFGALPTSSPEWDTVRRSSGTFGYPTFTSGWLIIAILWSAVGGITEKNQPRWWKIVYWAGIVAMIGGLLLTGTRSSLAGLLGGTAVMVGAYLAIKQARRVMLVLIGLGVVGLALLPVLVLYSNIPVFERLSPAAIERDADWRGAVWENAIIVMTDWPVMNNSFAEEDPQRFLRPIFGYGLDQFEQPHLLYVGRAESRGLIGSYIDGRTIDRAHNDWLDIGVMMGWFGVVARISVFSGALWVGLRRLGLWSPVIPVLLAAGAGIGLAATWGSFLMPIAATIGAAFGMMLWFVYRTLFFRPPTDDDRTRASSSMDWLALLACGVIFGYMLDLQLSFMLVANTWIFWLVLGGLLREPGATSMIAEEGFVNVDLSRSDTVMWAWMALGGSVLLRNMGYLNVELYTQIVMIIVLLGATMYVYTPGIKSLPYGAIAVAVAWALGVIGGMIRTPELSALWDVAFIVIALFALYPPRTRERIGWSVIVVAFAVLLWLDVTTDIYMRAMQGMPEGGRKAQAAQVAARLRPWDSIIVSLAGSNAIQAAMQSDGEERNQWLLVSFQLLNRASQLDAYEAKHSQRLAFLESILAQVGEDEERHITRTDLFFHAATLQFPHDFTIWQSWVDFTLNVKNDPELAREQIAFAIENDPDNLALRRMGYEIELFERADTIGEQRRGQRNQQNGRNEQVEPAQPQATAEPDN